MTRCARLNNIEASDKDPLYDKYVEKMGNRLWFIVKFFINLQKSFA